MKKLTVLILALIMTLSLASCGSKSDGDTSGGGKKTGDITQVPCEIAIHDYFLTSFSDDPYIVLYLDITNKADKSLPADDLANPVLYQNGAQVADLHDDDSWMKQKYIVYPDGYEPALRYADKIQSGATATVYYVLPIKNTIDDIDVEVYGGEELVSDDGSTYIRASETLVFSGTIALS